MRKLQPCYTHITSKPQTFSQNNVTVIKYKPRLWLGANKDETVQFYTKAYTHRTKQNRNSDDDQWQFMKWCHCWLHFSDLGSSPTRAAYISFWELQLDFQHLFNKKMTCRHKTTSDLWRPVNFEEFLILELCLLKQWMKPIRMPMRKQTYSNQEGLVEIKNSAHLTQVILRDDELDVMDETNQVYSN